MKNIFVLALVTILLLSSLSAVSAVDDATESAQKRMEEKTLERQRLIEKMRIQRESQISKFRERVATKTAELKTRQDNRKEVLQERLKAFRNQKKARVAERVNNNLNMINEHKVKMLTAHLAAIETILGKVKDRTTERATDTDITAVNKAITDAQTAIDSAKAALVLQAAKDYTLTVTDEESVKKEAKAKRELLHTDLKSVHDKVITARKAVSNAIKTAYGALGRESIDTISPTPTGTVTFTPTVTMTVTPTITGTQ